MVRWPWMWRPLALGDVTNQMEISWEIDPKKIMEAALFIKTWFDVTMLDCKRGSLHMQNFRICNGLCMGKRGKEPRSRQFFVWFLCGKCFCAGTSWFLVKIWYIICWWNSPFLELINGQSRSIIKSDEFPTRNTKSPIKDVLSEMREISSW